MRFSPLAASAVVLLAACGETDSIVVTDEDDVSAFETDDQRILYTIGTQLGLNIEELRLTEEEFDFIEAGMRDVINGSPYQVDVDVYGPQMQNFANRRLAEAREALQAEVEAEKIASAEFAETIAAEPGAERSASGLIFVPLTEGDGASPEARDTVTVHYHGTLRDGTVFDSSIDRGEPAVFPLNQVIPCWTEAMQKLRVGGSAKLLCPSNIAYGDEGLLPVIPGGASLLFEVELLDIAE